MHWRALRGWREREHKKETWDREMICSIEGHRERGDRLNNGKQGQEKIRWGQDDSGKRRKGETGARKGREGELVTESLTEDISIFLIIPLDESWEREEAWGGGDGVEGEREQSNSKWSDVPCCWHVICSCVICACVTERERGRERPSECEPTCAWCVEGQEFREPDESEGRWTQTNCACVSLYV